MRIGELSRLTGASPRSLRYYEQLGLITAERRNNGYRDYPDSAVTVVGNIRALLAAGLAMAEIQQVGDCLYAGDLAETEVCDHIIELYERRLAGVEANLADLADVRERLHAELGSLRENRP
ncbi:DNA-binding transcriptional MerR regulator [Lipingzhangella halophila]|uniref:DNA-binding transcriptional MerR regulator n=1 Tax=Lipingzhangella halophila TaxID=1783352 RepID=A0A7W7RJR8_9ACTN|nr:MerR family transcriptional regulator [Lipingzhangella halophila]MBB4933249.1 DNA-binding transcriptional MerR regulator [Lipingzhangella halophila]